MTAFLVLSPGGLLPFDGSRTTETDQVPDGFDPRAGLLGLLGQDPVATWTGPAAFAAAGAGIDLAEDETAYLLSPVRVDEGRIQDSAPRVGWRELREALDERLEGEVLQLGGSDAPVAVLGETLVGPPALSAADLRGRDLRDLPAGPPALLGRLVEASRQVCAEACHPGGATHLFPHSPGGPSGVESLRQTWIGLGQSAVVGQSYVDRALARLLQLRHVPARVGREIDTAAREAEGYDLVLVVCADPPGNLGKLQEAPKLALVGPGRRGRLQLRWRGGALGEGLDLLRPWALRTV